MSHNNRPAIVRPHVALAVSNIAASVAFYSKLFDVAPSKVRTGYANFSLDNPGLNLALNKSESGRGTPLIMHFGFEVASAEAVLALRDRIVEAGLPIQRDKEAVRCCGALQDKFWLRDPDGHAWEVFAVVEDGDVHLSDAEAPLEDAEALCCDPGCCQ